MASDPSYSHLPKTFSAGDLTDSLTLSASLEHRHVPEDELAVDLEDSEDLSSVSLSSRSGKENYYGTVESTHGHSGPSEEKEKASMLSSVSNLSNTILGAGMLGLPFAIEAMGLAFGIFMLFLSALGAYWGLYLLTIEGTNPSSYPVSLTYPSLAIAIDVTMAIKCFGVATSYLIVIADLMPDALKFFIQAVTGKPPADSFWVSRTFWLLVFIIPAVSLASLKRLDEWRFTSYFAIATVVYITFLVIYFLFKLPKSTLPIYWVRFNTQFFSAFPIFLFAYTCHQNLFTIYNELKGDEALTKKVSQISTGISAATYLVIGLFGFFTFRDDIKTNILRGYPSTDVIVTIARVAISLHVVYSYRLQMHPSRKSTINIFHRFFPKQAEHWLTHWIVTAILCTASFAIAFFVSDLGIVLTPLLTAFPYLNWKTFTVFGVIGATGSTMICYVLPGLFYIGLHKDELWRVKKRIKVRSICRYFFSFQILALISSIVGILVMISCNIFIALNATVFKSSNSTGSGH